MIAAVSLTGWGQSRQMESLGRGLVAIHADDGKVFVSWRLLRTDPDNLAFNLYRQQASQEAVKLNIKPLIDGTSFLDQKADFSGPVDYFVRPLLSGIEQPRLQALSL